MVFVAPLRAELQKRSLLLTKARIAGETCSLCARDRRDASAAPELARGRC
jgi:hypothetical protein